MNSPYFSVIIPVFNREKLVIRAIESVLSQSFKDYELILIDDGSTDNTLSVLQKYHDQAKIFSIANHGVSYARNYAVDKSLGKYLCFLDSDDEWLSHKLQKQFDFLKHNPQYKIIHGEELWVRNGKKVNPKLKHKKGGGDQFIPSLSLCLISPSTVCIERDSFLHYSGFREDFIVCEDYDLWLKFTANHKVGFIEDPLIIKYGGHADQLSQKYHSMDLYRIKSMAWVYENMTLDNEKSKALLDVFNTKAEILKLGYEKHNRVKELAQLETITSRVRSFSS